eukprot:jgi/Bigna1/91739/estExt_fgenesh1_pg.C_1160027
MRATALWLVPVFALLDPSQSRHTSAASLVNPFSWLLQRGGPVGWFWGNNATRTGSSLETNLFQNKSSNEKEVSLGVAYNSDENNNCLPTSASIPGSLQWKLDELSNSERGRINLGRRVARDLVRSYLVIGSNRRRWVPFSNIQNFLASHGVDHKALLYRKFTDLVADDRYPQKVAQIIETVPTLPYPMGKTATRLELALSWCDKHGYKGTIFLPRSWTERLGFWDTECAMNKISEGWFWERLNRMVAQGQIVLTPHGMKNDDDKFMLAYARSHDSPIVSNDLFRDHVGALNDPKDRRALRTWLLQRRVSFMFIQDEFLPNPENLPACPAALSKHQPTSQSSSYGISSSSPSAAAAASASQRQRSWGSVRISQTQTNKKNKKERKNNGKKMKSNMKAKAPNKTKKQKKKKKERNHLAVAAATVNMDMDGHLHNDVDEEDDDVPGEEGDLAHGGSSIATEGGFEQTHDLLDDLLAAAGTHTAATSSCKSIISQRGVNGRRSSNNNENDQSKSKQQHATPQLRKYHHRGARYLQFAAAPLTKQQAKIRSLGGRRHYNDDEEEEEEEEEEEGRHHRPLPGDINNEDVRKEYEDNDNGLGSDEEEIFNDSSFLLDLLGDKSTRRHRIRTGHTNRRRKSAKRNVKRRGQRRGRGRKIEDTTVAPSIAYSA